MQRIWLNRKIPGARIEPTRNPVKPYRSKGKLRWGNAGINQTDLKVLDPSTPDPPIGFSLNIAAMVGNVVLNPSK